MLLKEIREELVELNQALPEDGLCNWVIGNMHIRVPESEWLAIKPSY
jgi:ribulose-5-phosphate 4-epimerase/fuculose-1-phosphate aldolase